MSIKNSCDWPWLKWTWKTCFDNNFIFHGRSKSLNTARANKNMFAICFMCSFWRSLWRQSTKIFDYFESRRSVTVKVSGKIISTFRNISPASRSEESENIACDENKTVFLIQTGESIDIFMNFLRYCCPVYLRLLTRLMIHVRIL